MIQTWLEYQHVHEPTQPTIDMSPGRTIRFLALVIFKRIKSLVLRHDLVYIEGAKQAAVFLVRFGPVEFDDWLGRSGRSGFAILFVRLISSTSHLGDLGVDLLRRDSNIELAGRTSEMRKVVTSIVVFIKVEDLTGRRLGGFRGLVASGASLSLWDRRRLA